MNSVIIMGRLTATPELRTTNSGVNVTTFTVAVDRDYVKAGEERQTDFLRVIAWKSTAEFVTRYFTKGKMIAVEGSIQNRKYTDKDGNEKEATEIIADTIHFCGDKKEDKKEEKKEEDALPWED